MKSLRWETWEICGGRYVGGMGNTRSMRLSEAIPPVGLQRRGRGEERRRPELRVRHHLLPIHTAQSARRINRAADGIGNRECSEVSPRHKPHEPFGKPRGVRALLDGVAAEADHIGLEERADDTTPVAAVHVKALEE